MTAYTSYEQAKYDEIFADGAKTASKFESYTNAVTSPDLDDFLAHQWQQWENAMEAGDTDNRWASFEIALRRASDSLHRDSSSIAMAFIDLGSAIARLQAVDDETITCGLDALISKIEKDKKEALTNNIKVNNRKRHALKETAQELAVKLWAEDRCRNFRIYEMANEIYQPISKIAERNNISQFPELPDGLLSWLRPVAPASAKKGGRPPKKKP